MVGRASFRQITVNKHLDVKSKSRRADIKNTASIDLRTV